MKKMIFILVVGFFFSNYISAEDFDFKDPKGVNSILIKLDSPLEPINGIATGISGKVSFVPKDAYSLKGELMLSVDSLKMPNDKMTEIVKNDQWLDVSKHPNIKVTIKKIISYSEINADKDNLKLAATSIVEIKGIEKEMTIHIQATYLKDQLGNRIQKQKGDLLVLRTTFTVKRDDFKIKAGEMLSLVANEIEVTAHITGACSK